jgi:glycosyltransferase involved in cell wall biosynthesis
MKIGIFDPYLDDLGGGEKYIMMLASCLSSQHEVTIFWDNENDIVLFKKRFGLQLNNIRISKNIFSSKVGFFEKLKAVRKYDAVIVLSDGAIPFVFPTKLFLHIQQPLPQKKKTFKDKIKRKHISTIFYNSQFTKHFNDSLFPGVKSEVIYPPVSLELGSKTHESEKENVILHVGRFRIQNLAAEDYKKQGFMIDSFKKLVDSGFRKWKFIIAASVKKEDEERFALLQQKAKGYPIDFEINKTNEELFRFYNKAKIYWHASGYGEDVEKHPELAEHFGISTVEAMGSGVVPVVINSGGQREIVTDGKNGLLWNSQEELLVKTRQLAGDEKLWHQLSRSAIIRAKDFTPERFCEAVTKLVTHE